MGKSSGGKKMRMGKDQRGFTIVELLIAVAILSIVVAAVCGFILVGSNSYATANSDINVQQSAQLALNQMSDVLIDTTRSVNYVGYDADNKPHKALKDAEFTFTPENKCLIMFNGMVEQNVAPGGATSTEVKEGNGNKHYQFYWSKADETLYYTQLDIDSANDVDTKAIHFPTFDPTNPDWVELATHVTDFSVDLTQVEEKRVVMLALTFKDGKKEYVTSNNVTIRNKVGVNDAALETLDKRKTLDVKIMDKPIVEPGETFHFSVPKVTGQNVADKSVEWTVVTQSSRSGGTVFTDAANGILKVAKDEPSGKVKVMVKTKAKDSEGNQASDTVEVDIKRVTSVTLSKTADDNPTNGPKEVSPGCTFTVSVTSVGGNKLGETCSVCGEDTTIDKQVSYEGNPCGCGYVWRVYNPSAEGGTYDTTYVQIIESAADHATFKVLDSAQPSEGDVTHGFVIQAVSLLSLYDNAQGRHYDGVPGIETGWVPGAIDFTVVKGKNPALPLTGGKLTYGSKEDDLVHNELHSDPDKGQLRTDGEKLITAIRVVDNNKPGVENHKIILYDQGGRDTRVWVDLFDLDLNGSYTFYIQVLDVAQRNGKEDTYDQIWQEYIGHVHETVPYDYYGTRYDYRSVRYAKLDKPKITYTYDSMKYTGQEFTLRPVDISMVNATLVDRLQADKDGFVQVDANTVMNNMKYSIYKGEGETLPTWEKLVYFDKGSLSYKKGESNLVSEVVNSGNGDGGYNGMVNLRDIVTMDLQILFSIKTTNNVGERGALCGTYHIVPGITYRNKADGENNVIGWRGFAECPYTSAGGFHLIRETKYYEFDDSTFHVKFTDKYTMDIVHDNFTGRVMFPRPEEMKKDWRFPNMNLMSPDAQSTTGALTVTAKRGSNNWTENLTFTYVKYYYVANDKTWVVEPVAVEYRQGATNVLVHSYGEYKWSEKDEKWICITKGTTRERPFKIQRFDFNNNSYRADFPLPTDNDFPFKSGTGEIKRTMDLYDSNMNKEQNVPTFLVSCEKTGDTYELKFRTETRDSNKNNHKIKVNYYGTYTWTLGQTKPVWTWKSGYSESYVTDFVPTLKDLKLPDGNTYMMDYPLPTDSGFRFKNSGDIIRCNGENAYDQINDLYAANVKEPFKDYTNRDIDVKYTVAGGMHTICFYRKEKLSNDSNNHKWKTTTYGIYDWTSGSNSWKLRSESVGKVEWSTDFKPTLFITIKGREYQAQFPLPSESGFDRYKNAEVYIGTWDVPLYEADDTYAERPMTVNEWAKVTCTQNESIYTLIIADKSWGSSTVYGTFTCSQNGTKWE